MLYLDNAATTKPLDNVLRVYTDACQDTYGNSGSLHALGFSSLKALENARKSVVSSLGLRLTHEALFTAGATESNNLALKGVAFQYQNRGKKILTSSVEHPSVKNVLNQLKEQFGFEVVELPVNENGVVLPSTLEQAMDKQVILVSIMAANNEVGSINDIPALGAICKKFPKCFFHVDATQAVGKEKIDYSLVDLISFSSHKIGGLKGQGALLFKKTIRFLSLHTGGEQEFGFRSGTVDVPGALATACALKEAIEKQAKHYEAMKGLNAHLRARLGEIEEISINSPENASPFILNFSFRLHKASVVVEALSEQGYFVSSVSACSSKGEPSSYVLAAMGKNPGDCANSIRVSPSSSATKEELDSFVETLKTILTEVNPR